MSCEIGAWSNLSDILADRARGRLAQVVFFESKIGIESSYTFELDVAARWIDMIYGHRRLRVVNQGDLLESIGEDHAGHHRGTSRSNLCGRHGSIG